MSNATKDRKNARMYQRFQQVLTDNKSPALTNCDFLLPEFPEAHKFIRQAAYKANTQPICFLEWYMAYLGQMVGKSKMISIKEERGKYKEECDLLDLLCLYVIVCLLHALLVQYEINI